MGHAIVAAMVAHSITRCTVAVGQTQVLPVNTLPLQIDAQDGTDQVPAKSPLRDGFRPDGDNASAQAVALQRSI